MRSLSEVMITVKSIEEVPFDLILSNLNEYSYACVRGLFSPEEILAAKENISAVFDAKNDKKHDPKDVDAIRGNLQKLQVGGTKGVNSQGRFLSGL